MTAKLRDRRLLQHLAAARGEVFTTDDALRCGWSPSQIRAELAAGRWHRLRRGVFVETAVLEGADASGRHRLRAAAAVAATTDTWTSHESAAALWGLERLRRPSLERIELTRPSLGAARVRRTGDLDVHECRLPPGHRVRRAGVRTTSVARTVVDLARTDELVDAVVLVDSALRRQRSGAGGIAEVVEYCAGWPGRAGAAAALSLADPLAESVFESVSRVELTRRGLVPETQCWLTAATGPSLRVDFLWWRERTIGEADGLGKYAKYGPSGRDPLQLEKVRQEQLEEWGFEVVRWGWREMRRQPDSVASRVLRGFARSTLRQEIRARNNEPDVVRRLPAAPWDLPRYA